MAPDFVSRRGKVGNPPDLGSGDRRFEPCRLDQFHLVEGKADNPPASEAGDSWGSTSLLDQISEKHEGMYT